MTPTRRRRLAVVAAVALVTLLAAWGGARLAVARALQSAFPDRITWSSLQLLPYFALRDVALADEDGHPMLGVAAVEVHYAPLAALRNRSLVALIGEARVVAPHYTAHLPPHGKPHPHAITDVEAMLRAFRGRIAVENGEVHLEDARVPGFAPRILGIRADLDGSARVAHVEVIRPFRLRLALTWPADAQSAVARVEADAVEVPAWVHYILAIRGLELPRGMRLRVESGRAAAQVLATLRASGVDLVGRVQLQGLDAALDADGTKLPLRGWNGVVRLTPGLIHVESFRGAVLGQPVELQGRLLHGQDPRFDLTLRATGDLARVFRQMGQPPVADGSASLMLRVHGGTRPTRIEMRLRSARLTPRRGHLPALRDVDAELAWDGACLRLFGLRARSGGGTMAAHGYVVPAPGPLDTAVRRWASARLLVWVKADALPIPGTDAAASVDAVLLGTPRHPVACGSGDVRGLGLRAGPGLPTVRSAGASFLLDEDTVSIADGRARTSAGEIHAPAAWAALDGTRSIRSVHAAVRGRGLSVAIPSAGRAEGAGFNVLLSGDPRRWIAGGWVGAVRLAGSAGEVRRAGATFVATPSEARVPAAAFTWQGMPFAATASGRLADRAFDVTVASSAFDPSRLRSLPRGSGSLRLDVTGDPRSAVISGLLDLPYGSFDLHGLWDRTRGVVAGLRAAGVDLGRRLPGRADAEASVASRPSGTVFRMAARHPWGILQSSGRLAADGRSVRVNWDVSLANPHAPARSALGARPDVAPALAMLRGGSMLARGSLSGSLRHLLASIDDAQLYLRDGSSVALSGRAEVARDPRIDVLARLRGVEAGNLQAWAAGRASGGVHVFGRLSELVAQGGVLLQRPYLCLPGLAASAAHHLQWDSANVLATNLRRASHLDLTARRDGTEIHGGGRLGRDGYRFDVTAPAYPLKGILGQDGPRALDENAHADLSLHVAGHDLKPEASLLFSVGANGRPAWLSGALRWLGHSGRVRLDSLQIRPWAGGLASLQGTVRIPARRPSRLAEWLGLLLPETPLEAAFNGFPLRPVLAAGPTLPDLATRLFTAAPATGSFQPKLDGYLRLAAGPHADGALRVSGLGSHGTVSAKGAWDGRTRVGSADVQAESVDLAAPRELFPDLALAGMVDAKFKASGPMARPQLNASVDLHDVRARGLRLGDLSAALFGSDPEYHVSISSDVLGAGHLTWNSASGVLEGSGNTLPDGRWSLLPPQESPSWFRSLADSQVWMQGEALHVRLPLLPGQPASDVYLPAVKASVLLDSRPRRCPPTSS